MFKTLVVVSAAVVFVKAQDMTAIVTSATESGLLAYTTITTACLPAVDLNSEPIFSIQTDTNVESCTYVVNADNYSQVVSTIGATTTGTNTPVATTSDEVPLSTLVGTNTGSMMSGPPITTSTTIPINFSASATSDGTSVTSTRTSDTTAGGSDQPSTTSQPAETSTGGAVGGTAAGGEMLGFVGFMAILAAL